MKIIKGDNSSYQNSKTFFLPKSLSKLETYFIFIFFILLWIALLIISIFTGSIIHQENYFYPFSNLDKTSKTFHFSFKRFNFLHRSLQLDCSFVRPQEGNLPQLKMENHVIESLFFGSFPNYYNDDIKDLEINQDIVFGENEYVSNTYSFFLKQKYANPFINLTLLFDTNFSKITGFNFYFSQGNYNNQLLLLQSKFLLFLLSLLLIFSTVRNNNIKNTYFYKIAVTLETLSCLSLNVLPEIPSLFFLDLTIPIFTCAFFYAFRIFSLLILQILHDTECTEHQLYTKFLKIFISIYSILEFKELYDQAFLAYKPRPFKQNIYYHWLIIFFHVLYSVFGISFIFKMFLTKQRASSSQSTSSFNIILFFYSLSLLTNLFVNGILRILNEWKIMNSIIPYFIYQFPINITVFIYHTIAHQHAIEFDNYFNKQDLV